MLYTLEHHSVCRITTMQALGKEGMLTTISHKWLSPFLFLGTLGPMELFNNDMKADKTYRMITGSFLCTEEREGEGLLTVEVGLDKTAEESARSTQTLYHWNTR